MSMSPLSAASKVQCDAAVRRLLTLFRELPADRREMVLAFAAFLASRSDAEAEARVAPPPPAPRRIARPAGESVVAAIKRLRASYPMLAPQSLLDETARLMGEHVLQGRSAAAVIDDLEAFFQARYAQLRAEGGGQ